MNPTIILYTKGYCPHCKRSLELLRAKGMTFTNYDLVERPELTEEMVTRAGGRTTVPQIFIDDFHVGGAADLFALEEAGKLDPLLKRADA
jgi:glutaredoxin 3